MAIAPPHTVQWPYSRPLEFGAGAFVLIVAVYFGVVGAVSGPDFALDQFSRFRYFLLALALGFAIQVGLYVHLKNLVARHAAAGRAVAASATTSTLSMVSCCAHYLANVVPLLGVAGFFTVIAQYQIELFWAGLVFNAAGIAFVSSRVFKAAKEHPSWPNKF